MYLHRIYIFRYASFYWDIQTSYGTCVCEGVSQGDNPNQVCFRETNSEWRWLRIERPTEFEGYRPVHLAAANGYGAVVRLLIELGAHPNSWSLSYRIRPLHSAVFGNQVEVVRLLLQLGADKDIEMEPTYGDGDGPSPLHVAAGLGKTGIIPVLLEFGETCHA